MSNFYHPDECNQHLFQSLVMPEGCSNGYRCVRRYVQGCPSWRQWFPDLVELNFCETIYLTLLPILHTLVTWRGKTEQPRANVGPRSQMFESWNSQSWGFGLACEEGAKAICENWRHIWFWLLRQDPTASHNHFLNICRLEEQILSPHLSLGTHAQPCVWYTQVPWGF